MITNKIRKLPKSECTMVLCPKNKKPSLVIIRDGNPEMLKISNRVAEELIAMGLSYGD
jgi:hypothetical protein